MENYFSNEIKQVDRELLHLVTAAQKSAGVVPSIAETIQVDVPLALSASGYISTGIVDYKITPTKTALIMATLGIYYDDIMANHASPATSRIRRLIFGKNVDGDYIARIYVTGNDDDTETLRGGGSVSVPVSLTVRCKGNFTLGAA